MPMDTIINMKKQNEKIGQFLSAVEQPRILAYYPDEMEKRIMGVFKDIKTGLEQAIEYEKGNLDARTVTLSITPVDSFTPSEIKTIRNRTGLTQIMFAKFMGVSVKTVEAWESGRNHPEGTACRLLTMTSNDPTFPVKSGIVNFA